MKVYLVTVASPTEKYPNMRRDFAVTARNEAQARKLALSKMQSHENILQVRFQKYSAN